MSSSAPPSSCSSSAPVSTPASTHHTRLRATATRRLNILDLPHETQHAIFSHCDIPELLSLSVVSQRFHELAAAQLYRLFHVVLTTSSVSPRGTGPVLRSSAGITLTGGLDTLTTSDYDYARFLRHFFFDVRSIGDKARPSYLTLQYSVNGGRFLNTLLHLALRNAKSLETFKWNIPVELNRRVFKTLHQLPLNELHIRWHIGLSHYEPLRPLPLANTNSWSSFDSPLPHPHHHHSHPQGPPPPPVTFSPTLQPYFHVFSNGLQPHFGPAYTTPPAHMVTNNAPPTTVKPSTKPKAHHRQYSTGDPPTLSGFKYLKRLAVLNVDSLDLIPEIKTCIANSESTLTHLSLSFSTPLALEARETVADQDPDATELDDDVNGPQHTAPTRPPMAQKEWIVQESVLARVFGVEKGRPVQEHNDDGVDAHDEGQAELLPKKRKKKSPEELFIASLKEVSKKLLSVRGAESLAGHSGDIEDVIGKAMLSYFESDAVKQKTAEDENNLVNSAPSEEGSGTTQPDTSPAGGDLQAKANDDELSASTSMVNLDLNDTEEEECVGSDSGEDTDASLISLNKTSSLSNGKNDRCDKVWPPSETTRLTLPFVQPSEQHNFTVKDDEAERKQLMSAYVKSIRGLGLASLGLHLIPVKASVLHHALDLQVLQTLTLLNVGNQAPLWTLLARENQVQPLALRNIFTDNVSPAFIRCVSQLDKVYELFMIERSERYRPATFLPWTTVTIHNIRKQVLRKHLGTLKRLMIRNDDTHKWDLDAKTIILLCAQGAGLEELSAGFHMRGVHTLIQHIAGLRNLHALHISPFRNDDTCAWAIQETTKFFIDSLVRYPQHRMEWLGVGERATRIIRTVAREPSQPKKTAADKKGKGKAVFVGGGDSGVEEITLAFAAELWSDSSGEESSDEEDVDSSDSEADDGFESTLKLRAVSRGLDYVDGVRIFEKEVRAGEL